MKNWPSVLDDSVKFLDSKKKSPSMMGSIASRLKILKSKMREDSQDLTMDSKYLEGEDLINQINEDSI